MTIVELVQVLRDGGMLAGLLLILVGGFRRWWVWGYQLVEMQRERDEWKGLFLRSMKVAETAVSVARTTKDGE